MQGLRVMKFGGAALQSAEWVAAMARLLEPWRGQPLVLVVSAAGKTTNRLERLVRAAAIDSERELESEWGELKALHDNLIFTLLGQESEHASSRVTNLFIDLRRVLEGVRLLSDAPPRVFDRIMAYGELLSSVIVAEYLRREGWPVQWLDSRSVIKTDLNHRQAQVLWGHTQEAARSLILPLLDAGSVPLVQGFIGSGADGSTTTLGREGSDYTAALLAAALGAEEVVVWKDVPGVLSGDPRWLSHTKPLERLSYDQAVEMTYYGASVIHPHTIRPLFNADIPLRVRSFLDTQAHGTHISPSNDELSSACQFISGAMLIQLRTLDLAFFDELQIQRVFQALGRMGMRTLLTLRTAICLYICVDAPQEVCHELLSRLADTFELHSESGLTLITEINAPQAVDIPSQFIRLEQLLPNARFLLVNQEGLEAWLTAMKPLNHSPHST